MRERGSRRRGRRGDVAAGAGRRVARVRCRAPQRGAEAAAMPEEERFRFMPASTISSSRSASCCSDSAWRSSPAASRCASLVARDRRMGIGGAAGAAACGSCCPGFCWRCIFIVFVFLMRSDRPVVVHRPAGYRILVAMARGHGSVFCYRVVGIIGGTVSCGSRAKPCSAPPPRRCYYCAVPAAVCAAADRRQSGHRRYLVDQCYAAGPLSADAYRAPLIGPRSAASWSSDILRAMAFDMSDRSA